MKVGLDCDEVLCSLIKPIFRYLNQRLGRERPFVALDSFYLWEFFDIERAEAVRLVHDFYDTSAFPLVQAVDGAVEGVTSLSSRRHELYVITSRPATLQVPTETWLAKHFGDAFSGIHLTNGFGKEGPVRHKRDICDFLGIDVFVDDHVPNVSSCNSPKREVVLFDRQWNRGTDEFPRVRSWEELVTYIGSL